MKEKKTGKFGRAIGWLVSICLIAALSGGLVASYPRMVKEAGTLYIKEIEQQKMDSAKWYLESVLPLMYGMYTDWK